MDMARKPVGSEGSNRSSRCISYRGKTFQGGCLVGEFGKYLVKLGHPQNFLDLWRESHYLHGPASLHNGHVIPDQFANAGTVQVFQSCEIQNDIGLALLEQSLNH